MNSKHEELGDAPLLSAEPARREIEIEYFRRLAAAEVVDPIVVQFLHDWKRMQKSRLGWLVDVLASFISRRSGFGRFHSPSPVSTGGSDRRCAPTPEARAERDLSHLQDPIWKLMSDYLAQSVPSDADFDPFAWRRPSGIERSKSADPTKRAASLVQELHLAHDLVPIVLPLLVGVYVGRRYDQLVENAERTRTVLCIVAMVLSLLALALFLVGPRLLS